MDVLGLWLDASSSHFCTPHAGLWTDDERREVLDAFRPWLSAQQAAAAATAAAERPAGAGGGLASVRGSFKERVDGEAGGGRQAQQSSPLTEGPDAVWAAFVERARANLHWVLAMSPVGDAFRARCARKLFHSLAGTQLPDSQAPGS